MPSVECFSRISIPMAKIARMLGFREFDLQSQILASFNYQQRRGLKPMMK